jgi:hypothetical protein
MLLNVLLEPRTGQQCRLIKREPSQVRNLNRLITADEYDFIAATEPELCPMHYMGDQRRSRVRLCKQDILFIIAVENPMIDLYFM